MSLILPRDYDRDVLGINERVRRGDPTVGWRGDQTMDVILNTAAEKVEVWGFDRAGNRYIAASESVHHPGWRHRLLERLRDGDWQRPGRFDEIQRANDRATAARQAQVDDRLDEAGEKLHWALRRDVGQHFGGLRKEHY